MSITFWVPDAPLVEVERACMACDGSGKGWEDEPCPYCSGTGKELVRESTLPEVNMANGNALAFLRVLVGDAADYCGTWTPQECAALSKKLLLLHNGKNVEWLATPDTREGNFIECGRSADYVTQRAGDMLAVLVAASKAGMSVSWG